MPALKPLYITFRRDGEEHVYRPEAGCAGFSRVIVRPDPAEQMYRWQPHKEFALNWPGRYTLHADSGYALLWEPRVRVDMSQYVWGALEYTLRYTLEWPRRAAGEDGEAHWDFGDATYYWLADERGDDPNATLAPHTEQPEGWNDAAETASVDYDPKRDPNAPGWAQGGEEAEGGAVEARRLPWADGQAGYPRREGWCQAAITVHKHDDFRVHDEFFVEREFDWGSLFPDVPDLTPLRDTVEVDFGGEFYRGVRITTWQLPELPAVVALSARLRRLRALITEGSRGEALGLIEDMEDAISKLGRR